MSYTGLLEMFAERTIGPLEDYIFLVEHNAAKAIKSGTEPGEAYRWAMSGVMDWVREKANKARAGRDALSPPGEAVDGRLTLALGELLNTRNSPQNKILRKNLLDGVLTYVVYVVRDGEAVLYVGFTAYNAEHRIKGHLSGRSALGQAIRRACPRSREWTVEMISHPDKKTGLAVEKQLQKQYKPRYCAAYMQTQEMTTYDGTGTTPRS